MRDWPLIGERTYALWNGASRNLEATVQRLHPEVVKVGKWALSTLAGPAGTVLQFFISALIAGVFLFTGERGHAFSVKLATQSTTAALIFLIYDAFVSFSDTFLKPLLLGRGLDVPMLVILLGAIGGMIMSGILGLFVGAVVLAVAYQLMKAWLEEDADLGIFSAVDAPLPAEGEA